MRTAIVTYAQAGLAPGLTLELARRGWRLVLGDPEARGLEAQAAGLATATEVIALSGDPGDEGHCGQLVEAAGPHLEVLVNNAAPSARRAAAGTEDFPLDDLEDAYRETVLVPLGLMRVALPRLATGGRVISVLPAGGDGAVRASAAAALAQLTEAVAEAHPEFSIRALRPATGAIGVLDEIPSEAACA